MTEFISIFKAEIYKTKRTGNLAIVILFPLFISLIVFFYYLSYSSSSVYSEGINQWLNYSNYFFQFYQILYPIMFSIIAFSMSNIEHKNNGYKKILTLPISKFSIYFSKVIILLLWLILSLVFAYSLLILSGNFLSYVYPQLGFQDYNLNLSIFIFFVKIFFTLISIISIHYFLSVYWENFAVTVGSSSFLVILGLIIQNWKYSFLIPYCNIPKAFHDFYNNNTNIFNESIIWSLAYSFLFFVGGYIIIMRTNMK